MYVSYYCYIFLYSGYITAFVVFLKHMIAAIPKNILPNHPHA